MPYESVYNCVICGERFISIVNGPSCPSCGDEVGVSMIWRFVDGGIVESILRTLWLSNDDADQALATLLHYLLMRYNNVNDLNVAEKEEVLRNIVGAAPWLSSDEYEIPLHVECPHCQTIIRDDEGSCPNCGGTFNDGEEGDEANESQEDGVVWTSVWGMFGRDRDRGRVVSLISDDLAPFWATFDKARPRTAKENRALEEALTSFRDRNRRRRGRLRGVDDIDG